MSTNQIAFDNLSKAIAYWESTYGDKFNGYAHPYKDREIFDNLANFYSSIVNFFDCGPDGVGCDLGCWLGFPAYLESITNGSKVYGIEIQESFTKTAREWAEVIEADNVHFQYMRNGTVPLETGSVDWVLINQVLCNALSDTFENSVREAARILKPGGSLIICDSNNPYHEPVRTRLAETYLTAEIGPSGTLDAPNGYNHRSRKNMIVANAIGIADEDAEQIAKGTCYLSGSDVISAAKDFQLNGKKPTSFFDPESELVPCAPATGAALGNPTNPYTLSRIAEAHGLDVMISTGLSRTRLSQADLYNALQNAGSFYIIADKPE